jgi:hypothetical protein
MIKGPIVSQVCLLDWTIGLYKSRYHLKEPLFIKIVVRKVDTEETIPVGELGYQRIDGVGRMRAISKAAHRKVQNNHRILDGKSIDNCLDPFAI